MTFDKTLPLRLTQALLPFAVLHLFSSHDALTVQGFHFIKSYPHMISTRTVKSEKFSVFNVSHLLPCFERQATAKISSCS